MHRNYFGALAVFLFLLFFTSIAHAQFSFVSDPVTYVVAPEVPGPYSPVRIEVQGVGSFIGSATITWQKNGVEVSSGVGITTFNFTTESVGTPTRIHVTIASSQGTFSRDFYFAPSVVNLVWEADTSAPLFYLGKTRYSPGSSLKVAAFPTVVSGRSLVPSSQLSFQWSHNDNVVPEASGLGRNTFTFNGDQIQNSETVSVNVYLGAVAVGHSEITIPATDPQLAVYAQDPLRGELLDRILPSMFNLDTQEVTLRAEPYFFSNDSVRTGGLVYNWLLNGGEVQGPDSNTGILTLRQTGSGPGAAAIRISTQNIGSDLLLQQATAALQMGFGQQGGSLFSSLFGL